MKFLDLIGELIGAGIEMMVGWAEAPVLLNWRNRAIGLMGVENDGKMLVTPKGHKICAVPRCLAWRIQRVQHWGAIKTWQ